MRVPAIYAFDDFRLDCARHVLLRRGQAVPLAPKAFDLLLCLIENRSRVLRKDELLKAVWPDSVVEESNLSQTVFILRKTLDEQNGSKYIETLPRVGYRFIAEVVGIFDDFGSACPSTAEPVSHTQEDSGRSRLWKFALPAICFATGLALAWLLARFAATESMTRPPDTAVNSVTLRSAISLPANQQLAVEAAPSVTVSPDGTKIVYAAHEKSDSQLFLRHANENDVAALPGTAGAIQPVFSPDGQWVAFFSQGKLKKISVNGGPPVVLCDAANPHGVAWKTDGSIVFAPLVNSSLMELPNSGGVPRILIAPDAAKGEAGIDWPEMLPGGKGILFTVRTPSGSWDEMQIAVQSFANSERRVLIRGGTNPRYSPTGHVIFARDGTVFAVPFDLNRLVVTGTAIPVAHNVMESSEGAAHFSFSNSGLFLYVAGDFNDDRQLVWVDRRGVSRPLAMQARAYEFPRLSPDDSKIAVMVVGAQNQIGIQDIVRNTWKQLTFNGSNSYPVWTPDGKRVTFTSNVSGKANLYWKAADNTQAEERLTTSDDTQVAHSWTGNGATLAFVQVNITTELARRLDIAVLDLKADRQPRFFLKTAAIEDAPMLSPDGHWLAYASNESGRFEIYVQPFPPTGGVWKVSTGGGSEPLWARDGRQLFYRNNGKLMEVELSTRPAFAAGTPKVLFEDAYRRAPLVRTNYDVSRDGRFLMIEQNSRSAAPSQFQVVSSWFEELQIRSSGQKPLR